MVVFDGTLSVDDLILNNRVLKLYCYILNIFKITAARLNYVKSGRSRIAAQVPA
jgi:hypothetical protein